MRSQQKLSDREYSTLQEIEGNFVKFLKEKSYSSDSMMMRPLACGFQGNRVQSDLILKNPETGIALAAIVMSENANAGITSLWNRFHKVYAKHCKNEELVFYLVFRSEKVGFRILQLKSDDNWVPVKKEDFPSVSELMAPNDFRTMADPTNWETIEDRFNIISQQLKTVNTVTEYNQIGMGCRKILDGISRMISESIQGMEECADISPTDLKRNFELFCTSHLSGKKNEDLRKLVKSTYDFAAVVAHRDLPTLSDARICYYAVLNLSDVIKELLESLKD